MIRVSELSARTHFERARNPEMVLKSVRGMAERLGAGAVTANFLGSVNNSHILQFELCLNPDFRVNNFLKERISLRPGFEGDPVINALEVRITPEDLIEYTNDLIASGERVRGMFPVRTPEQVEALKDNLELRGFKDNSALKGYLDTTAR